MYKAKDVSNVFVFGFRTQVGACTHACHHCLCRLCYDTCVICVIYDTVVSVALAYSSCLTQAAGGLKIADVEQKVPDERSWPPAVWWGKVQWIWAYLREPRGGEDL